MSQSDEAASPDAEVVPESDDSDTTPSEDPGPDPAHAGNDNGGPGSIEELIASLEAVTAERNQHLEDLQRVSAEFANFRKQNERRHADFVAHATAKLAEALLPVLDACEAAARQGVEGVEQVGHQLVHVLEQEGLEVIADESMPFDPNRHEAAFTEPGDDGQEVAVVGEVLRTGYAFNGRVLRAAMVKVKG